MTDLRVKDSALSLRRAALTGAPNLVQERTTPLRQAAFRSLRASTRDMAWPAKGPVPFELEADLPDSGTLAVDGSADLDTRAVNVKVDLKDAALAPYQALLPFDAPIGGEASAALTITARTEEPLAATVTGQAELRRFSLGPPDRPVVSIEHLETSGIDVQWPREIRIDLVKIVKPVALVEREKDRSFPLRAMLAPRDQARRRPRRRHAWPAARQGAASRPIRRFRSPCRSARSSSRTETSASSTARRRRSTRRR